MSTEFEFATAGELRQWAESRGIEVSRTALPKALIAAWDRTHPDRPYKAAQCGTNDGYNRRSCRCDKCRAANTAYAANRRST